MPGDYSSTAKTLQQNSIVQGVLGGPYYQFWFLYLLLGLYIVTPVLRVVIKHADWEILRYLIFVWFVGTAIIPLLTLFGSYSLNANVFIFTGWLGYFVLGAYFIESAVQVVNFNFGFGVKLFVDDNGHLLGDCNYGRKIWPLLSGRLQLQHHLCFSGIVFVVGCDSKPKDCIPFSSRQPRAQTY